MIARNAGAAAYKRDCLILDFAQNLQEGGDLFTPAIQLGVPGDAPVVPILEIACPECDHENLFRKASWPADMGITKTGFCITWTTKSWWPTAKINRWRATWAFSVET